MSNGVGLKMGTRAGSIDPGVLLALLRDGRLGAARMAEDLEHHSGLLGVAGTADMRSLVEQSATDATAHLAIEMYVRRAAAAIGAAWTALPSVDALVFTGGIGEHAAEVRERIVTRLGSIGVGAIGDRADHGPLTRSGGRPAVLRIEAREDVVIAESSRAVLESGTAVTRPRERIDDPGGCAIDFQPDG